LALVLLTPAASCNSNQNVYTTHNNLADISVTQKSVVSCMRNRVNEDRFIAATKVATAMVKENPL